jgi:hypothetical protein
MAQQPFFGALAAFLCFVIQYTVGRTPWAGDQPVAMPLPNTDIHASSEIRTHDPSVRVGEDSSCLRPLGHCDRCWFIITRIKNYKYVVAAKFIITVQNDNTQPLYKSWLLCESSEWSHDSIRSYALYWLQCRKCVEVRRSGWAVLWATTTDPSTRQATIDICLHCPARTIVFPTAFSNRSDCWFCRNYLDSHPKHS